MVPNACCGGGGESRRVFQSSGTGAREREGRIDRRVLGFTVGAVALA
jgi:hypothetical protein